MSASILVVDVQAQSGGFLDDGGLTGLAAAIAADGHRVRSLRWVCGRGGSDDELLDDIRSFDYRVVILSRAWDAALLAAIRGALGPDRALIRLAPKGVAGSLDAEFDHILDRDGVLRFLSGDTRPEPARWKPTATRLLKARLQADDREPEAPTAVGSRPVISGPVGGCPYLRDTRQNPLFASLEMDPTAVQTKGCAFCLDNTGAYTTPSAEKVLDSWLGQLERIRRETPRRDDRPLEILLTAERPHPYLAKFFTALVERPELAPVELLIKSRVDWLLEFADSTVAEAAGAAAATGSVLHVYLIGFENFDAGHLELFNKGHGVAENLAAIDVLRDLERRFPTSFEYRRHRAHGIVLFTPWTRPEALLENAEKMRRVGFHELRSEAVRTRLRLYDNTPLYHLAARDGLLAERFAETRPDRAAEQGYDASAPWRFQDPRTEAIFVAATGLARRDRTIRDADALELGTRFVLRWPGLADAPEAAEIALGAALGSWGLATGDLVSGLGAAAIVDRELELLAAGAKAAALKESVPREQLDLRLRACRAMGFHARAVSSHDEDTGPGLHREGRDHVTVAVTADAWLLDEVMVAQRAVEKGDRAAVRAMGAMMGYPPCCVDAFAAMTDQGDNLANERFPFVHAPEQPLDPRLHRLGAVRLISHHLCSPACSASAALADRALGLLSAMRPDAATWVMDRLTRPVLFIDFRRRVELRGRFQDRSFAVDSAASLGDERRLGFAVTGLAEIELSATALRLAYRDGRRLRVSVDRPLLTTPSRPLHAAALAAIETRPALPPLPETIRRGVRVRGYDILAVERDARGPAHVITLGRADQRITLRATSATNAPPRAVRLGPWAVGIEANFAFSHPARRAIEAVLRQLRT